MDLYILGGGGDESKKQWFIKIGGFNMSQYLYDDEYTPKPYFWDHSFIGKLFPFKPFKYVDRQGRLYDEYKVGYTGVYFKQLKYQSDDGPLKLVFYSSSLDNPNMGLVAAVLIYKVVR